MDAADPHGSGLSWIVKWQALSLGCNVLYILGVHWGWAQPLPRFAPQKPVAPPRSTHIEAILARVSAHRIAEATDEPESTASNQLPLWAELEAGESTSRGASDAEDSDSNTEK